MVYRTETRLFLVCKISKLNELYNRYGITDYVLRIIPRYVKLVRNRVYTYNVLHVCFRHVPHSLYCMAATANLFAVITEPKQTWETTL